MPHAFRFFQGLKKAGLNEAKAAAVVSVVESAMSFARTYSCERITDELFDANFSQKESDAFAALLQHCFVDQKSRCWYDVASLKTALETAAIPAPNIDLIFGAFDGCVCTRRTPEIRAPIKYDPKAGRVVMCDFTFLQKPEMQKERRAIVVSTPPKRDAGRCAVIPVSKSIPRAGSSHNVEFVPGSYPFFHSSEPVYAVCDHVYTLSVKRMWQINIKDRPTLPSITPEDLARVRSALARHVGIKEA